MGPLLLIKDQPTGTRALMASVPQAVSEIRHVAIIPRSSFGMPFLSKSLNHLLIHGQALLQLTVVATLARGLGSESSNYGVLTHLTRLAQFQYIQHIWAKRDEHLRRSVLSVHQPHQRHPVQH